MKNRFDYIKIFALVLITFLYSCKVQYSMIDGSIEAETFTVDVFEEQAANAPAGYGGTFTNYLKDFIISRTKLNLSADQPDLEITGKIMQYGTTPVSVQSGETAALNRLTVSIFVSVINNKNEKQSFENTFTQFSDYEATQDLAVVESALIEDINSKISQDIINKLTSNW